MCVGGVGGVDEECLAQVTEPGWAFYRLFLTCGVYFT